MPECLFRGIAAREIPANAAARAAASDGLLDELVGPAHGVAAAVDGLAARLTGERAAVPASSRDRRRPAAATSPQSTRGATPGPSRAVN